jgi:hypothetical protein
MLEYLTDPSLADTPMALSELEAYAADPAAFVKDPRKVPHLLRRLVATVQLYKTQITGLKTDVHDMQLRRDRAGAATTMSPRDAVRFLSPQELSAIVGGTSKQLLDHAARLQQQAEKARREANAEMSRARFVLLSVLESPDLPAGLRGRLEEQLASFGVADLHQAPPVQPAGDVTVDGGMPADPGAALDDLFADDEVVS